jgi:hypothetical protein
MRKSIYTLFAILVLTSLRPASAQELFIYDNTDFSTGQAFYNGGTANQSGNLITRLLADDLTPAPGFVGEQIYRIYFGVANGNANAVSARPRIRFYAGDGAGGGPGTYITGFTFNAISFPAGGSGYQFSPTSMTVPAGTFWIGMTFDNNTGATGATQAEMDNLGLLTFNPPTIGTSADQYFLTTAAGSFLASNPAGTLANFGGTPVANFYFGISVVPEPTVASLLLLGATGMLLRRRRRA